MDTEVRDFEQVMVEEAQAEFEEAGKMALGSKEHEATVKTATMITEQLNEMNRIKNEAKKLEIEEKKAKNDKFKVIVDGTVKVGTTVLAGALFLGAYVMDRKDDRDGILTTSERGRQAKRSLFSGLSKFF